jgi:hypothetical protein
MERSAIRGMPAHQSQRPVGALRKRADPHPSERSAKEREATNLMRAKSERLAPPQLVLADYFLDLSHNDSRSRHATFPPEVANRGRNVP